MKKIILVIMALIVGLSGCISLNEIVPSMSSATPFQVKEGESVTFQATLAGTNSPVSEAIVRVAYVDPNQLIKTDATFVSTMTIVGSTDASGSLKYTIPTGVSGKRLIFAIEKPSSLYVTGFGMAYVF